MADCGWLSCLVWLWLWLAEVKTNVLDMYAVLADEADEVIILVCLNLELGTSLFEFFLIVVGGYSYGSTNIHLWSQHWSQNQLYN